jgi:hypothetical protein
VSDRERQTSLQVKDRRREAAADSRTPGLPPQERPGAPDSAHAAGPA